jgi:4-hydroxy-3-polyprenylbenzoate decarboxylase
MFFIGRCRVEYLLFDPFFVPISSKFSPTEQTLILFWIFAALMKRKIVIAITGASGAIYAQLLLNKLLHLRDQITEVAVVMSDNAKQVWEFELDNQNYNNYDYKFYAKNDFMAPFASGSAKFDTMVVIPCSMGTLGRIASGTSDDLIIRAADVILKERRKLILVARDMPLNLIQIRNMETITEAGGIICPAVPSYYSKPATVEEVALTVVNRVIDLMGLENDSYRWSED